MTRFQLRVDDQVVIDADVNLAALVDVFSTIAPLEGSPAAKSAPITVEQAELLLQRIDRKSAEFLKRIAENKGSIKWSEMQTIFGIEDNTWTKYSAHYGKGITRALRHITGGAIDVLVHWDDDDPNWQINDSKEGKVYVDGKALDSLRAVFKLT